jgi:hypothetical protein
MKPSRTTTFASGLLVVVAVLIFLSNEKTSRKESAHINSRHFAMSGLFAPEDYSSCRAASESMKNIKQDGGEGQIYILAFQLAALFGLSNEKT